MHGSKTEIKKGESSTEQEAGKTSGRTNPESHAKAQRRGRRTFLKAKKLKH
jgi:hypothetical protein